MGQTTRISNKDTHPKSIRNKQLMTIISSSSLSSAKRIKFIIKLSSLFFVVSSVTAFLNPPPKTTIASFPRNKINKLRVTTRQIFQNSRYCHHSKVLSPIFSLPNGDNQNQQQETETNTDTKLTLLQQENEILRNSLKQLEEENHLLKQQQQKSSLQQQLQPSQPPPPPPPQVIIETFEGEGKVLFDEDGQEVLAWYKDNSNSNDKDGGGGGEGQILEKEDINKDVKKKEAVNALAAAADDFTKAFLNSSSTISSSGNKEEEELCDANDPNDCPVEPNISFVQAFKSRAYWLVGLLILQSCSGFILARNEELLQAHPVIVYFLTMLVGAGGNAGNQASVRVIRGLALGTLNDNTQRQFLTREFKMALSLSSTLSLAGFARALLVRTPLPETVAITSALTIIVFSSICLGAILPLGLKRLGVDPAHSSTTIQVVMDILGVLLTVLVSTTLLDSPFGKVLISKLGF